MTTAYAQRPQPSRPVVPPGHLRLVPNTAPAQGPEAAKMIDAMPNFRRGTLARGQSAEAATVLAVVGKLQLELTQHIESLRAWMQGQEELTYDHIPVKPVFSVQATYKYIGKLKPRHFPLDE